jgi:hypothetical protein
MSGTSASCPAIAGFISNINAARIAAGKGSLGFLNPAIYAYGSSFTNDITSGSIFCVADGTCCPQGFYAAPGWDPTTGFGSVNYGKMASVLVGLGSTIVPTSSPVVAPIPAPVAPPVAAPVAAGSPLSGYFISASYSDSTCGALRYSTSYLLNACVIKSDSSSSYFTATSTEVIVKDYTDSACKLNQKINRKTYTGLCSGQTKEYVSGATDPSSTAPAIYFRLVHALPLLALALLIDFSTTMYNLPFLAVTLSSLPFQPLTCPIYGMCVLQALCMNRSIVWC